MLLFSRERDLENESNITGKSAVVLPIFAQICPLFSILENAVMQLPY